MDGVCECVCLCARSDVASEAVKAKETVHVGRIHELCHLKGSELPEDHVNHNFKGRDVFLGNQVKDQNADHAIFSELSSSPAAMEASNACYAYGAIKRNAREIADAIRAYIQAKLLGIKTWVRLPRNRWPKSWQ